MKCHRRFLQAIIILLLLDICYVVTTYITYNSEEESCQGCQLIYLSTQVDIYDIRLQPCCLRSCDSNYRDNLLSTVS